MKEIIPNEQMADFSGVFTNISEIQKCYTSKVKTSNSLFENLYPSKDGEENIKKCHDHIDGDLFVNEKLDDVLVLADVTDVDLTMKSYGNVLKTGRMKLIQWLKRGNHLKFECLSSDADEISARLDIDMMKYVNTKYLTEKAVEIAVASGNKSRVELLVDTLNVPFTEKSLLEAASKGFSDILDWLRGRNKPLFDFMANKLFHAAIVNNHLKILRSIINITKDVEIPTRKAIEQRNIEILTFLFTDKMTRSKIKTEHFGDFIGDGDLRVLKLVRKHFPYVNIDIRHYFTIAIERKLGDEFIEYLLACMDKDDHYRAYVVDGLIQLGRKKFICPLVTSDGVEILGRDLPLRDLLKLVSRNGTTETLSYLEKVSMNNNNGDQRKKRFESKPEDIHDIISGNLSHEIFAWFFTRLPEEVKLDESYFYQSVTVGMIEIAEQLRSRYNFSCPMYYVERAIFGEKFHVLHWHWKTYRVLFNERIVDRCIRRRRLDEIRWMAEEKAMTRGCTCSSLYDANMRGYYEVVEFVLGDESIDILDLSQNKINQTFDSFFRSGNMVLCHHFYKRFPSARPTKASLHHAAYNGSNSLLKWIVMKYPEYVPESNALEIATTQCRLHSVQILVDYFGECAIRKSMIVAASRGFTEIWSFLYDKLKEKSPRDPSESMKATTNHLIYRSLLESAKSGHFHLVRYLFKKFEFSTNQKKEVMLTSAKNNFIAQFTWLHNQTRILPFFSQEFVSELTNNHFYATLLFIRDLIRSFQPGK